MKKVEVTMYTTAVCPYCLRAKQLLERKGITNITYIRIDENEAQREEMIKKTGRRTVPQIFINDLHIGGYDDLAALDKSKELDKLIH